LEARIGVEPAKITGHPIHALAHSVVMGIGLEIPAFTLAGDYTFCR